MKGQYDDIIVIYGTQNMVYNTAKRKIAIRVALWINHSVPVLILVKTYSRFSWTAVNFHDFHHENLIS